MLDVLLARGAAAPSSSLVVVGPLPVCIRWKSCVRRKSSWIVFMGLVFVGYARARRVMEAAGGKQLGTHGHGHQYIDHSIKDASMVDWTPNKGKTLEKRVQNKKQNGLRLAGSVLAKTCCCLKAGCCGRTAAKQECFVSFSIASCPACALCMPTSQQSINTRDRSHHNQPQHEQ